MIAFRLPCILLSLLCVSAAYADFEDLIRQGDYHDAQFQPEDALRYYTPAEKLRPDEPSLLVKIARQHVYRMDSLPSPAAKLDACRTALTYAERAVQIAPQQCDPHLATAICLGKMTPLLGNKQAVEASRRIKTCAETAIKLNPRNDFAWHMLGRWHQELAQVSGVTRTLAQIVYGGLPSASLEEAKTCFEKAAALAPKRLIHAVELGRTYALLGKKDEARQWIRRGLSLPDRDKDDPETRQRGLATLRQLGDR
ncbi:MAG: hypothetical protein LDL31_08165 [Prosthecobacter sp.]|jgi:tetratricopeptide (TPR) repeat protein|nr:hypothetical protein [Prosthecobacter sp.]